MISLESALFLRTIETEMQTKYVRKVHIEFKDEKGNICIFALLS